MNIKFLYASCTCLLLIFQIRAYPSTMRTALRRVVSTSAIAGACYWGLTKDGQKTRATVWEAAHAVMENTAETAEKAKDWLNEKFSEQKDDHTVILASCKELTKQNKELRDQTKVLKRQNALILSKLYDLEEIVAHVNTSYYNISDQPEKPSFLTDNGDINEKTLVRKSHFLN